MGQWQYRWVETEQGEGWHLLPLPTPPVVQRLIALRYSSGTEVYPVSEQMPAVQPVRMESICQITEGAKPFYYQWSNGATSDSITGLLPGMYYVTVRDAFLNAAQDSILIKGETHFQ